MEGYYSPEPGEIIDEIDIGILKRDNHKRRRSSDRKYKRKERRRHYKSRSRSRYRSRSKSQSKQSKAISSSSVTVKGSPKQFLEEANNSIKEEEDINNDDDEPSFFESNNKTIDLNSKFEERRKRLEAIRIKHQVQNIEKTPIINEEPLSISGDASLSISNNNKNYTNTNGNSKQQESFIKFIEQERELLTKQEQLGDNSNIYPPNDNPIDNPNPLIENQSPLTPDMFGDDNDSITLNANKPNPQQINLSFTNQTESIGYYIPQLNEIIHSQYKVIGLCGKGVFSSVVKVLDIINNIEYALKIIRNIDIMKSSGDKEKSILTLLNKEDPEDKAHIIRLKDSFEFNNHLCMIIDLYQMNLRDLIKKAENEGGYGIPMNQVKSFAKQLILGFSLIHRNRLIHADFKPDNTVIDNTGNHLRICDFGSAFHEDEAIITSELVSRYYRAPEIILGMKPNQKIDIWSLGCTLFELYTGTILFPGKSNNEMIRMFIEMKGKFSKKFMKRCSYADDYFSSDGNYFKSKEYDSKVNSEVIKEIDINQFKQKDIMTRLKDSERGRRENDVKSLMNFANFLECCFALDPFKRILAIDALSHPFLIISN